MNDMVGIMAGKYAHYLYKLLSRLAVTPFLTYVDTESLSMRSVPISLQSLKLYITWRSTFALGCLALRVLSENSGKRTLIEKDPIHHASDIAPND